MATNRTVIQDAILEGTTPKISGTLTNSAGAAITLTDLLTLTLTLYNLDDTSYPIINGRAAQDAKNVNRVAVTAQGVLTWNLAVADAAIVTPVALTEQRPYNTHRAVFSWTYQENGVDQAGSHIIEFKVLNLEKIT